MSDYTQLRNTHHIPMKKVDQPTYSLILAISEEGGLEHYDIYKKGFNEEMFEDYLNNLYIANKHHRIAVFMDNCSSHKTTNIKLKMRELEIESIFNVYYMPDYNPTESCFSKVKNYYKRKKLNMLMNEEEVDSKSLIRESV